MTTKKLNQYLIITDNGRYGSLKAKITNTLKVHIPANAVVLKLNLELPVSLFKKPQLEATISIPDDKVSQPTITTEVMENIKEVLKSQIGVDMKITLVENQ